MSSSSSPISSETTTISKDLDPNNVLLVTDFIKSITYPDSSLEDFTSFDSFSILFQSHIKALSISRGRISCSVIVTPAIASELVVEGSVVRSGRNLTVVNVEFKMKDTMKVTYLARATFYHSIISKL